MIVLLQAVLIFFGLNTLYWLIYKYLPWRGSFVEPIAQRVRLWVFLLIPLCALQWVGARLYPTSDAGASLKSWLIWLPRTGIVALLIIVVVETLLVVIFNYYYAVRRRLDVPAVIQTFVRAFFYLLTVLIVLFSLFNIKVVTGILAGALVLLVGLALLMQDALSNLFAGFSLQVTHLYRPGDWLRVGQYQGQVESSDWRSLTIRTESGDRVILPLSMLAKVEIVNLTPEQQPHADEVTVVVDFAFPPEQVEREIRAALRDIAGICAEPAPETRLLGFEERGIRYAVKYWIATLVGREAVMTAVHRAIWYYFRRAHIRFASPTTDVFLHREAQSAEATEGRACLLRGIRFLQILSMDSLQQLANRLHPALFAGGETICRQGEPGDTFYVIARGRVRVSACDADGRESFAMTLQAGEFFGEFSLLTGEPRSATVVAEVESELLVMAKNDMREALDANPKLAEHISAVLAQRQHELQESRARLPVAVGGPASEPQTIDSLQREILRKIVNFFAY